MVDKPNLTLIKTAPIDDLPKESVDDFKLWVKEEQLKPSVALHKLMEKYDCQNIHDSTVLQLLKLAYPEIDVGHGGFRFKIIDSEYPNSNPDEFSDEDFDNGIAELLKHPTGGW